MTPSEAEFEIQKHLKARNQLLFRAVCEEEKAREKYIDLAIGLRIDEAKVAETLAKKTIEKAYLSSKGN